MQLNLSDADSIVTWWQVLPDRHGSYLAYKAKASPEFAPTIREALRRISADPALAIMLAQAVQRTQLRDAEEAARRETLSAHELRHLEFATA